MAVATDVRTALAAVLQPLLIASGFVDDVFEIVPGRMTGMQSDKDRGSIWTEGIVENDDTAALENIEVRLRVFKKAYVSRGGDLKPFDPSVLESVGQFIQTSTNTIQAQLGAWSVRVTEQSFVLEEQCVEVAFVAVHGNLGLRTYG